MVNRSVLAVLMLLVTFALVSPGIAQKSETEKEILALEDKMNAAYAANDLPTYFAYYADDFTQWLPEGRTDLPQYKRSGRNLSAVGARSNRIRFPTCTYRSVPLEIPWLQATSYMSALDRRRARSAMKTFTSPTSGSSGMESGRSYICTIRLRPRRSDPALCFGRARNV
jgi:hypothetical protein